MNFPFLLEIMTLKIKDENELSKIYNVIIRHKSLKYESPDKVPLIHGHQGIKFIPDLTFRKES